MTSEFLVPLIIILIASQLAGWLSHRVNLPSVFGILVVGLLLGPSVFGLIHSSESLTQLAQLGVLILMFLAGLETDAERMLAMGKASLFTALGGVLLPFVGGAGIALYFGIGVMESLFIGTILTATSVSITARTLQEMGKLQSRVGTVILGAAVIDDILGVVVLSLVIGLAGGGDTLWSILKMVAFFPVAIVIGYFAMPTISRWLKDWHHHEAGLAIVLGMVLLFAWTSEAFGGMAAVTGAYLAGLFIGRTEIAHRVNQGASALGYAFFIPLFFVGIGLETQASSLGAMPVLTIVLVFVAIFSKGIGCFVGARVGGLTNLEALRIGVGMISRGEVALVIAALGLQARVIDESIFTTTVIMTLATTLVTPLLLKLVYMIPDENHIQEKVVETIDEVVTAMEETVASGAHTLAEPRAPGEFQPI
jgi:Kef-type K+ transport system membrane component KefB